MTEHRLRRASISARDRDAHRAWLERGRTGAGRLHIEQRRIVRPQLGAWRLTASRWVDCELHQGFAASVRLQEAVFEGCVWFSPNLLMACLDQATLVDTALHEARMATCTARGIKVQGSALRNAQLQKADWAEAVLRKVDFQGAKMCGIGLQRSLIEDCSFQDADLSRAALDGARFLRCDLRGATLPEGIVSIDCTR